MTMLRMALVALGLGFATGAAAQDARLAPFEAEFVVTWKGMTAGNSRLSLRRDGDGRWTYESHNAARGLFRVALPGDLTQRSTLRIDGGRVVPQHFVADDGTDSTKRDSDVRFDWAAGRATGTAEGRPVDLAVTPGLQDGLSVQIALMVELLAGRTPERFTMLDKDEVKDYLYTREGTESVETPLGKLETEIFASRRPGATRGTWFWCAPSLGYLPVKVERRNGSKVEWSMAAKKIDRE